MKKFWKVLGVAALAAGITPYYVDIDTQTKEHTYQALLWRLTSRPDETEQHKRRRTVDLGLIKPPYRDMYLFEDDATWCAPAATEQVPAAEDDSNK